MCDSQGSAAELCTFLTFLLQAAVRVQVVCRNCWLLFAGSRCQTQILAFLQMLWRGPSGTPSSTTNVCALRKVC